ncbi:sugar-binding protein [Bacillus atrophaeus]|nr:sugar-binding protein [Bacillus atrophaeus]
MSTDSEIETFRKLAAEFVQEFDSIRVKIHFPENDYENTPSTPFSLF